MGVAHGLVWDFGSCQYLVNRLWSSCGFALPCLKS